MPEQKVVRQRFEVLQIKGAMQYNAAVVDVQPTTPIFVDLEIVGEPIQEGVVVEQNELNRIVKNIRLLACATLEE